MVSKGKQEKEMTKESGFQLDGQNKATVGTNRECSQRELQLRVSVSSPMVRAPPGRKVTTTLAGNVAMLANTAGMNMKKTDGPGKATGTRGWQEGVDGSEWQG